MPAGSDQHLTGRKQALGTTRGLTHSPWEGGHTLRAAFSARHGLCQPLPRVQLFPGPGTQSALHKCTLREGRVLWGLESPSFAWQTHWISDLRPLAHRPCPAQGPNGPWTPPEAPVTTPTTANACLHPASPLLGREPAPPRTHSRPYPTGLQSSSAASSRFHPTSIFTGMTCTCLPPRGSLLEAWSRCGDAQGGGTFKRRGSMGGDKVTGDFQCRWAHHHGAGCSVRPPSVWPPAPASLSLVHHAVMQPGTLTRCWRHGVWTL